MNKENFEQTMKDSKFFSFRISPNDFEKIIYHCPECLNLPLIEINPDLITVNCQCENNHNYTESPIRELYQKLSETAFTATTLKTNKIIQCYKCKKYLLDEKNEEDLSKILKNYGYCHKCKACLCFDCYKKPPSDDDEKKHDPKTHKLVPLDRFITHCPTHRQKFSAYCFDCKENTCINCGNEHRKHKKYYFDENILLEDEVNEKKKKLNELKTNCELLENQVNAILDKIRDNFHEEMQKQMNLILFDELLLDAYQTNQYNYFYIENISKNITNIKSIEEKVNNQDPKKLINDLVINCDISNISNEIKINSTEGEFLQVSQPTKLGGGIKRLDYTKDTMKENFNVEVNPLLKNEDINFEVTEKLSVSKKDNKKESQSSFVDDNSNNKKIQTSFKISTRTEDINVNKSHKSTIKEENDELIESKKSIHSKKNESIRMSCEFTGNNYRKEDYKLSDLPNNLEIAVEIKNTGNCDLPEGCYLFDENNCGGLMIADNNIQNIEVGKSVYRQIKLDSYIYSKGSYNLKLAVKNNKGSIISTNSYEYSIIVE